MTNISYRNLLPDTNNNRDLGASGTKWKDGFFAGVLHSAGFFTSYAAKTNNYTATAADSCIVADGTSNTVTITLPTASGISGRKYTIKCIDATNTVTVDGDGAETIDGDATQTLAQWDSLQVVSDGTNWVIV